MCSELFNEKLIERYDVPVPRYTSYPTASQFYALDERCYKSWAQSSNQSQPLRPLSLYIHIPFCSTVCFYCACTKIITKNQKHAATYLEEVLTEIVRQADLFDTTRPVQQMHWGGGTPTFLSQKQMAQLMSTLNNRFRFLPTGEYSIELDPRQVDTDDIHFLRALGFNRLSLGVQDVDERVQVAVNRIQPITKTVEIIEAASKQRFESISLDLIYGLPRQTLNSFTATLDTIIDLEPDRLSVFNYAHLPHRFKVQRQIRPSELPPPKTKLDMLRTTIEKLCGAGYVYIGMDHFARQKDGLAIAQSDGSLHRNFQGYSTYGNCDLIGLGVSSIGQVAGNYVQNHRELKPYRQAISANSLPIARGFELNADDRIRRAVISELMCHFNLDLRAIQHRFQIEFRHYFAQELRQLERMAEDGLIEMSDAEIRVTNAGRLLVRNICSVFDQYLGKPKVQQKYSNAV